MNDFFDLAFAYLLGDEGIVFTNNPKDPGGATKFGVTKKAFEAFLKKSVDVSDIENMTSDTAEWFYHESYWRPLRLDQISKASIAIAIFDTAVLYGPGTSAIMAQKAVSVCGATIKLDGHLGDKSIEAFNIVKEGGFLQRFHDFILVHIDDVIQRNPEEEEFRKGWTNRTARLLTLISKTNGGIS